MSPLPSPPIEIREDQPSFDSSLLFFLISIYFPRYVSWTTYGNGTNGQTIIHLQD